MFGELTWVWLMLAVFLVVGLVVHERTGSRLGGVLVLPLLLVYALIDLSVLVVFAAGSLFSLLVGGFFYSKLLYYGRRLLYVFLLAGLVGSFVLVPFVQPDVGTIIMALLPGLFAYNLHREGRYLEGLSTFMIWFGVLLSTVTLVIWVATNPEAWGRFSGGADAVFGSIQAWVASMSPSLAVGIGTMGDSLGSRLDSGASWFAGLWGSSVVPHWESVTWSVRGWFDNHAGWAMISGVTFVSVAAAHGLEGGLE